MRSCAHDFYSAIRTQMQILLVHEEKLEMAEINYKKKLYDGLILKNGAQL
jgi:hypothetical protein